MDAQVVTRFETTLPADDDHPYRTGAWRPNPPSGTPTDCDVEGELPDDLAGVYLRNTENPLHAVDRALPPVRRRRDGARRSSSATARRATATASCAPPASSPSRTRASRCGPGMLEPPERSSRARRLGRTDADEGRVEHRRRRAQRPGAHQLLPVRRPLRPRPASRSSSSAPRRGAARFPARRACRPTPRSTSAPASCCSSATARRRRTCTTACVDADGELVALHADRRCPAPRLPHDMAFTEHYADPQRLPAVLGPRPARPGRPRGPLLPRHADALRRRAPARRRPPTSAGSRPTRPTCCTGSTPTRTATRSCSTASSSTTRHPHRRRSDDDWSACSATSTAPCSGRSRTAGGFNLVTGAETGGAPRRPDHGVRHDQRAPRRAARTATRTTMTGKPGWFLFDGL